MSSTKQHKKVRLSGNDDCCIVLCPDCNILELNLGASTVRINPESLHTISSILNNAIVRLAQMQNAASVTDNVQSMSINRVH